MEAPADQSARQTGQMLLKTLHYPVEKAKISYGPARTVLRAARRHPLDRRKAPFANTFIIRWLNRFHSFGSSPEISAALTQQKRSCHDGLLPIMSHGREREKVAEAGCQRGILGSRAGCVHTMCRPSAQHVQHTCTTCANCLHTAGRGSSLPTLPTGERRRNEASEDGYR